MVGKDDGGTGQVACQILRKSDQLSVADFLNMSMGMCIRRDKIYIQVLVIQQCDSRTSNSVTSFETCYKCRIIGYNSDLLN